MSKSRLEAFSDGIFAIIITIMVLEIAIPTAGNWQVLLERQFFYTLLSYAISYVLVTSFWISHHQIISALPSVDVNFMWINSFSIFPISLVPITTAWQSEFNTTAPHVVYGIVYSLTLLSMYWLSNSVRKRMDESRESWIRVNRIRLASVGLSIAGTLLSFIWPPSSMVSVIIITFGWLLLVSSNQSYNNKKIKGTK